MKVLVIYELIPEETKKAIVEMTENEWDFFKNAQNHVVNINDAGGKGEDATLVINQAFSNNPEHKKYCEGEKQLEYFGKWCNIPEIEDIQDVDKFLWCGFYL